MERQINWGIADDLQADIRYEPNACKGYVMDVSLGCPHSCIYCLFSPLELMVYKIKNPGYEGNVIPLKLDKFLAREEFPPSVYMCYASDPLGNESLTRNTVAVLKKLFAHNVQVLFISKGYLTDEVLDIIRSRPELITVQVGITNADDGRNKIIEPGVPPYAKRLENLARLAEIKSLYSLWVRIDPLLPFLDDTAENIRKIISAVSALGVKRATFGYVIVTRAIREKFRQMAFTRQSSEALQEQTSTISGQELFSFPFAEKMERFEHFDRICRDHGMTMSVCACKDERLKQTSLDWICHPYRKEWRKQFIGKTGFKLEYDHLM